MATNQVHNEYENPASAAATNGNAQTQDFEKLTHGMTHEEKQRAVQAGRFGYGPLAQLKTRESADFLPGKHSKEWSGSFLTIRSIRW